MPTTFDEDGKPGYIYNVADDKWYAISGKTDTSGTFEWSGTHNHLSSFTTSDIFIAKKGINNYLNPAARNSAIPSPTSGTLAFVRQDASGNTINQLQYYSGSAWVQVAADSDPTPNIFMLMGS